jgi:hypothetical protein
LKRVKIDLDGVKRKIQEALKKETLISTDQFNNLWNINPIYLKSDAGIEAVTIFKIEVFKSDSSFFSVKSQNDEDLNQTENLWVSLLKRADARTIRVDPRRSLDNK